MISSKTLEAKAVEAEQAAADARARVEELEAAIDAGNSKITVTQLEDQERAARAAELAARVARARIADALAAERNTELARIRDEITTRKKVDLAGLLKNVEKAVAAFSHAVLDYNDDIARWRHELLLAGCKPVNDPVDADPNDAGLTPSEHIHVMTVYVDGNPHTAIGDLDGLIQVACARATQGHPRDPYAELASYMPKASA